MDKISRSKQEVQVTSLTCWKQGTARAKLSFYQHFGLSSDFKPLKLYNIAIITMYLPFEKAMTTHLYKFKSFYLKVFCAKFGVVEEDKMRKFIITNKLTYNLGQKCSVKLFAQVS